MSQNQLRKFLPAAWDSDGPLAYDPDDLKHDTVRLDIDDQKFLDGVRPILQAWKEHATTSLEKIIFLLSKNYPKIEPLGANALKDTDARIVALLNTAASECGFCVGLSTADCKLSGIVAASRETEDDAWELAQEWSELYDREAKLGSLVDLEGSLLADDVAFDDEEETIAPELTDFLHLQDADREDWEGDWESNDEVRTLADLSC